MNGHGAESRVRDIRLSRRELALTRDIEAELSIMREGVSALASWFVESLRELLETEIAATYGLTAVGDGLALDTLCGVGFEATGFATAFDAHIRTTPAGFGWYNPYRPEARQRNTAISLRELKPEAPTIVSRDLWPRFGLGGRDQLRVLVCEGKSLLAWVGAFQPERFRSRQQALLQRLTPALRRRLRLERALGRATRDALEVAIEQIAAPAFVVAMTGKLLLANAAAKVALERDAHDVRSALLSAIQTSRADYRVTPLRPKGLPLCHLVVRRAESTTTTRIEAAAKRWSLSPRQRQVLAMVVDGASNAGIGAELDIADRTVETHLTAIFARAQVGSRAALIAEVHRSGRG